MPRGDLFPEIGPFQTGFLPLPDGHTMYWEQVGNPRGVPVLFLHGGKILAAGTPDEVRSNAQVQQVYLGSRH